MTKLNFIIIDFLPDPRVAFFFWHHPRVAFLNFKNWLIHVAIWNMVCWGGGSLRSDITQLYCYRFFYKVQAHNFIIILKGLDIRSPRNT